MMGIWWVYDGFTYQIGKNSSTLNDPESHRSRPDIGARSPPPAAASVWAECAHYSMLAAHPSEASMAVKRLALSRLDSAPSATPYKRK